MKQWRLVILIIGLVILTTNQVQAADLKFICTEKDCQLSPANTPFFTQKNMVPGSSYSSLLQVKNNSKLDGDFSLKVIRQKSKQSGSDLGLVMTFAVNQTDASHTPVVSALPVSVLDKIAEPLDLGHIGSGQTQVYELVVKFDSQAGNEYQGQALDFNLALTGQLDIGQATPVPFITPVVKSPAQTQGQVLGVTQAALTESWWWWLLIWLILIIFLIFLFRRRRRHKEKK